MGERYSLIFRNILPIVGLLAEFTLNSILPPVIQPGGVGFVYRCTMVTTNDSPTPIVDEDDRSEKIEPIPNKNRIDLYIHYDFICLVSHTGPDILCFTS